MRTMARFYTCDKCGEDCTNGSIDFEHRSSMNRLFYDLCYACYNDMTVMIEKLVRGNITFIYGNGTHKLVRRDNAEDVPPKEP